MTACAWGDESIRMAANPPMYLLAASWFAADDTEGFPELERVKPASAKKLHWMDMNSRLRRKSLSALAKPPMLHTVVVAAPLNGRKQERARRRAIEAPLPALETHGIDLLVLESRGNLNDSRDVDLLLSMRRKHMLSTDINLTHRRGETDSRLWVPDQVLGAYGDSAAMRLDAEWQSSPHASRS